MNKRFISLMLGVLMLLSVIAPVGVLAAPGNEKGDNSKTYGVKSTEHTTTDVVIHKLAMDTLKAASDETKYDGRKIDNLGTAFGSDNNVKELNGVTFTYWEVTETQLKAFQADSASYDTVEKVKAYNGGSLGDGTKIGPTAGGNGVTVDLADGSYWFVENKGSKLEDDGVLTDAKAVPFGLTLPMYLENGNVFDKGDNALHVYPKNTVKVPDTKKDFAKSNDADAEPKGTENLDTPVSKTVGDEIPYIVTTKVPAKSQYKTANWSDNMTEGLTYNDDLKVKIGDTVYSHDNITNIGEYQKTEKGFTFKLNKTGLALVNGKDADVTVKLVYSATLNSKAIVAIPESNDVTFHYGNNPDNGNTPIPTKPSDGQITVKKTWAEGAQLPEGGIDVTFTLYNAQTGKEVVVGEGQENPKTIHVDNTSEISHKWTGLDNDTEYKVVETYNGYSAEYQKSETAGEIKVVNHKDDNPAPINPKEPKVETYGKRFVKTNNKDGESMERLAGAEFIVTREVPKTEEEGTETQYLVKKSPQGTAEELKTYLEAKHAYENYIADHDTSNVNQDEVKKLMAARDEAFKTAHTQYEWKTADSKEAALKLPNIVKLVSDNQGRFEITGLEKGSYNLIETKKPSEEFADNNDPIAFEVNANSYKSGGIHYNLADEKKAEEIKKENDENQTDKPVPPTNAQRVINKKVTIPQTGGMGTIIFTVVGLAIMTVALTSLRKRSQEQ